MHFGQTMDAGLVPEWKSQYLNYRDGKRLIDRLAAGSSPAMSRLRGLASRTPRTPRPSHRPEMPWETSSSDRYPESTSDLVLPSPALPVNPDSRSQPAKPKSKSPSQDYPSRESSRVVRGPRGPVVNPTTPALLDRAVGGNNASAASSKASTYRHPHVTMTDRSPLLDSSGAPIQTYGAPPAKQGAVRTFYAWLDGELVRADRFYAGQEKEAMAKMRVLEVQLDHLESHRQVRKTENGRSSGLPRARTLLDRLDLPTLPEPFHTRTSRASEHNRGPHNDFAAQHVGYAQAKTMLRTAMAENYHDLVQLAEFRTLNLTAARKIAKKFDKIMGTNTMGAFLDQLKARKLRLLGSGADDMLRKSEDLYAVAFESGNHKHAVERLQVGRRASLQPHNASVLTTGLLVGAALPLLVRSVYCGIREVNTFPQPEENEIRTLLQIWGGFAIILVILVGMAINMAIWHAYRINYVFIFEFDRSTALDFREAGILPAAFLFGCSLFAWLTFEPYAGMHRYLPGIWLGIACAAFAWPWAPYWHSRKWLLHALWRLVLSGLYSVEFRDFFLGDLACSLNYSISNIEFFFCVYATPKWWLFPGRMSRCKSSKSRALGFLNCLPAIWRFLQCLRRFADTLDWFPHLLNAGKYTSVIMYNMTLSLARIDPNAMRYHVIFVVFAAINGVYTALWDVFMDFSLTPPELRSILVYPPWVYYVVMVLDPIMRQSWVLYAIWWNEKVQSAKISFIVALIEASRRVIWACIRVENEHSANIARNRAFKDLSLPYDDLAEASREEGPGVDVETSPQAVEMPNVRPQEHDHHHPVRRAFSYALSPSMGALSTAHVRDFQRRQTQDESDDDDEDED